MTIKNKSLTCLVSDFKALSDKGDGLLRFTCYGNVKGNVDHALDVTMEGAYLNSIKRHKTNGTMPKMLWGHASWEMPLGVWEDMEEDSKGLLMQGALPDDADGRKIYNLLKIGAIDSFSIGYSVIDERWNHEKGYNELHEIDIKEVSMVNFACNEESRLVGVKAKMDDGELPTKRELEKLLREVGLSRKQSELIASRYDDKSVAEPENVFELLADLGELELRP